MTMPTHDTLSDDADIRPSEAEPRGRFASDLAYDSLLDGLEAGQFCGVALEGSAPRALVEVLRRQNWPIDVRRFAAATPHFPERFELPEIRATLRNLGLMTARIRCLGRDLPTLSTGSMIVRNRRFLFVEPRGDGTPALRDAETGTLESIRPRRIYECVVVDERAGPDLATRRESTPRQIMARFGPEFRLLFILTLLSSSLVIAASMSVAFIFDTVLPARAIDTLFAVLLGIAALMAVDIQLRRIRASLIARISGRLDFVMSSELFQAVLGMPLRLLEASPVSEQLNRLKQFETVRDFVGGSVVMVLLDIPFVGILLLTLTVLNVKLGLVMLASLAMLGTIGALAVPRIRTCAAKLGKRRGEYQRLLTETLSFAGQIARRGLGPAFATRLQPSFRRMAEASAALDRLFALLSISTGTIAMLCVGSIAFVGAWQVTEGNLSGGSLIACTILGTRLLAPVQQALFVALRAEEMVSIFKQIDALVGIAPATTGPSVNPIGEIREMTDLPLVLDNVVLRYPQASEAALKGLTLVIPHGSFTCVSGASGAGKTTLLRAIVGNHALQAGRVCLGPINLGQLDGQQKSNIIGYHAHQSFLLYGTVAQNLRLLAPAATASELEEVTEELGLLKRIEGLPRGFDTVLDRSTRNFTTPAFRVRLGMARLLLAAPSILLLDEPEASLSPEDEERLLGAIERRKGGMSCILVSHRPSVLRRADRVVMMENGQMRFNDTPDKLTLRRPS